MKLREAIHRLRTLQTKLRNPHEFFATHQRVWLDSARNLTRATIVSLRPAEEMPEAWALKAETFASKISAHLHSMPAAGITLHLGDTPADAKTGDPRYHSDHGVNVSDLIRFVEEGIRGNPMGKRIKEEDQAALSRSNTGRGQAAIAWRMMYAIKRRAAGTDGLIRQLNRFLGASAHSPGTNESLAEALLKAWVSTLVPIVTQDWEAWLARRVRGV
jgi:hypothetical protein